MSKQLKVGDFVVFNNCTCGEADLVEGNTYEVIAVRLPAFAFRDESGKKRIRNINSRCFKIVEQLEKV